MGRKAHLLLSIIAVAVSLTCGAATDGVHDIDISVVLSPDGAARIDEVWNVTISHGTEWYLPRYNLQGIDIKDFAVSDESGVAYRNTGVWDVDASFEDKAGCCGMVPTHGGYELCWGLGSYGTHIYNVSYTMTNMVQAMDDYDFLHIQFVTPGISPRPRHARVEISYPGASLDSTNCAIWAFGYNGRIDFKDGKIVAETLEAFASDAESVIILARFDKGIFAPALAVEGEFEDKLSEAFEGSSYQDYLDAEREELITAIVTFVICLIGMAFVCLGLYVHTRCRNRNLFGVDKLKEIGYARDIPFGGNLLASRYVLSKIGSKAAGFGNIAGAMILRMIYNGQLIAATDAKGRIEISFGKPDKLDSLSDPERDLFDMLKQASGSDEILQNKEFSKWSRRNAKRVSKWCDSVDVDCDRAISRGGYSQSSKLTPEGQAEARKVVGLKNFLKDFTLSKERSVPEVALWQDYLVFASLYGIADKVAQQLKDINPKQFEEVMGYDPLVMHHLLYISNTMGSGIVAAQVKYSQTHSSVSGHGGFSSFGGGGGFSSGGFGGGAR